MRSRFRPSIGGEGDRQRRLIMAAMFFPRGGSAHSARALATELGELGWSVTLVSGSRSDAGPEPDAARFYEGLDIRAVDFAPALASSDPLAFEGPPGTAPMHPSFEERPSAPDPVFASLDDAAFERQVRAWGRELQRAGAGEADVLYLHHLTPLNEAAGRIAPGVPVFGHLHGTELLMLEAIERGAPPSWTFAARWAGWLREWARGCERLAVSPAGADRAQRLLGIDPSRLLPMSNGFDPDLFRPFDVDRRAHWRRHLVSEPRGWRPGAGPGSVAYVEDELAPLADGVVLLYVGRFTEVKRLPLLISAFARGRERFHGPAALVLLGGHSGEWEGEHPAETIDRLDARDVFLVGWHDHDDLPGFICASDAVVLASAREQFGLVLVEAMACQRPPIAAATLGPAMIVDDGETGWLFEVDDERALTEALVEVVNDARERRRRGIRAREVALERYAWPSLAERLDEAIAAAIAGARASEVGAPSTIRSR